MQQTQATAPVRTKRKAIQTEQTGVLTRRWFLITLAALAILLIGFDAVCFLGILTPQSEVQPQKISVTGGKPALTQAELLGNINDRVDLADPFLILINEWNPIPEDYTFDLQNVEGGSFQMQPEAAVHLGDMLAAGRAEGLDLVIRSTYRDHAAQTANFNRKLSSYLAQGISQETAENYTRASIATPGRSEHETGLAADIATSTTGVLGPQFAATAEYAWLYAHCMEYGFIQRYPKDMQDITGVYYEPWHYRYVGVENAPKIAASGLTLEAYLQTENNVVSS